MAAGNFTVLNLAKKKLGQKKFDLGADTFKMVLTTVTQSIAATFVGTSTDARYADLTNEVANGNGYTTGGKTLTCTWVQSTGTITFDCDDQVWTASTFTCQYAVIYDDTAANDDILGFIDLGGVSPVAGSLTVTINASGLFTLA